MKKVCYIIAGVNGSGKTTFAKEFLPFEARCINFVNADLIAEGLAPFRPENAAIKAAKIMIQQIDECIRKEESFAFETTLSGRRYIRKIKEMKAKGYDVVIYFLKLASVDLAIERVKMRVLQGGHNVPEKDIKRRFDRSWNNFEHVYKPLVDAWVVFDTSSYPPIIVDKSE
ncbi:MAG: zeta toxin family protein [Deltaproteobacteria bacterium]|nr:zeta toxin family protein [Deltaproteobacteria bacterium]MBW2304524.1 zeta toxin family protein [Deltaproteobacteria bacterium]